MNEQIIAGGLAVVLTVSISIMTKMINRREGNTLQTRIAVSKLLDVIPNSDPKYRKITPEEAREMMQGGNVVILDVRTESEFAEAHIEGAVLLPDYEINAMAPEVLTDKSETILIYCRSGRRSASAANALVQMGYTSTYDFGGIIDWPYETVSGK